MISESDGSRTKSNARVLKIGVGYLAAALSKIALLVCDYLARNCQKRVEKCRGSCGSKSCKKRVEKAGLDAEKNAEQAAGETSNRACVGITFYASERL